MPFNSKYCIISACIFTISCSSGNTSQNLSTFAQPSSWRSKFVHVTKLLLTNFKFAQLIREQVSHWWIKATQYNWPLLINDLFADGLPLSWHWPRWRHTGTSAKQGLDECGKIELVNVFESRLTWSDAEDSVKPTAAKHWITEFLVGTRSLFSHTGIQTLARALPRHVTVVRMLLNSSHCCALFLRQTGREPLMWFNSSHVANCCIWCSPADVTHTGFFVLSAKSGFVCVRTKLSQLIIFSAAQRLQYKNY